jgi:FMN phosphatase YigB (HAD superfamily)
MKLAGVEVPRDAVHVGDEYDHDIVGAFDAGMRTIWINPSAKDDVYNKASAVVEHVGEVYDIVKEWNEEGSDTP